MQFPGAKMLQIRLQPGVRPLRKTVVNRKTSDPELDSEKASLLGNEQRKEKGEKCLEERIDGERLRHDRCPGYG